MKAYHLCLTIIYYQEIFTNVWSAELFLLHIVVRGISKIEFLVYHLKKFWKTLIYAVWDHSNALQLTRHLFGVKKPEGLNFFVSRS
jgi:hypothetical protein